MKYLSTHKINTLPFPFYLGVILLSVLCPFSCVCVCVCVCVLRGLTHLEDDPLSLRPP